MGIYIHVPFCIKKCSYCEFYSITFDEEYKNIYLKALLKEIETTTYKKKSSSIYLGGGTPSLLKPEEIHLIINALYKKFNIENNAEITLEANPGALNLNRLNDYKLTGINRLSIGIQSLNDDELKILGRIHSPEEAINTLRAVSQNFDNFSVDIIYGIPYQNRKALANTLQILSTFDIPHISLYELTYHENTRLYENLKSGLIEPLSDDEVADLYLYSCDFFDKKNYIHYEISNFSLEGYQCIHNLNYWLRGDYVGFGPSAHSLIDNVRSYNVSDVTTYIEKVERTGSACMQNIILSEMEIIEEEIMLGLRTSYGIDRKKYSFSQDIIESLERNGFIKYTPHRITLTHRGMLVSNSIIIMLLKKRLAHKVMSQPEEGVRGDVGRLH
jgi:oxygen-independent coproporphyrinogen-3 oxidase